MLYDNALLLRVYAHWARRTRNPLARRVAEQTARFIIDDLAPRHVHLVTGRRRRRPGGLTYVWTPAQLREVLGDDDGRWAAEVFNVTDSGDL